jgi:ABC-2 type transport system permease protein
MPFFFFSGALFPLNDLPKILTIVARINPLSYGVDGIRATLTNVAHFGIASDLLVLSIATGIVLIIGSYLFSKIEI